MLYFLFIYLICVCMCMRLVLSRDYRETFIDSLLTKCIAVTIKKTLDRYIATRSIWLVTFVSEAAESLEVSRTNTTTKLAPNVGHEPTNPTIFFFFL